MTRFEELAITALELEASLDTEWAETHPDVYEAFDKEINEAYNEGSINDAEFNELACTAFYDYFELKEVD